ncbi:MAG: T9SS C-terminal target domain-containing protein [Allomuricauda sp.]|nr:MAG: T9SS C-terminal target domain-containing protein [Allomuricauda sp.]
MKAKLHLVFSITMFLVCFCAQGQQNYWKKNAVQQRLQNSFIKLADEKQVGYFALEKSSLAEVLESITAHESGVVYFPNKKGKLTAFRVVETPVFHKALAEKYPQIRSFTGIGVTEPVKVRFSISHKGLQAMCIPYDGEQALFIQKVDKSDNGYLVYQRNDKLKEQKDFVCSTMGLAPERLHLKPALVDDQTLRKFRIAVSTTGEYTTYHGGTVADALAAINATLTRVNEVFETDLGVTLELVPNNDLVIFTNASTDPYNGSLNAQVQNTLTSIIGEANYDVGHLFHEDNDNGNAGFIGSVCVDNRKGSAFSSALIPEGDSFDLDYVSHELGHQFGANHTWSFESEGTGVQAEPASGTTIMGYAGIVDGNNVAPNGDDYFHYHSIVQITDYIQTTSCAQNETLTNSPPVIAPSPDFVIPKGTAFVLTGSASDPDVSDILTYSWEQIDDGVVTTDTFGPDNPGGSNFRSLPPSTSAMRYFPKLAQVIQGNLTQTQPALNTAWETVSNVEREMNFALTVRDNVTGGGQVASDEVNVQVMNSSGPFVMTSQGNGETYEAGSTQLLTWDVANTNLAPVGATTVDIFLSTDGGNSFPTLVAANILNDGSAAILLPGIETTQARFMVKARNNIFFAVNSSDFTIQQTPVVLDFEGLDVEVCQPDNLIIPFDYEAYGGFNETSVFSVDLPTGLTASVSPSSAMANTSVEITISGTGSIAEGNYPITVTATSTSVTKQVILNMNLYDASFEDVVLQAPSNMGVNTAVNPLFEWQEQSTTTLYDIEIASDAFFTDLIESAEVPTNFYRSTLLQPETNYFWRVRPKNSCGSGTFGNTFSFTTSQVDCKTLSADFLPIEIAEQGTPTVTSTVTFVEDLTVHDVNVRLELNHSFLEDLIISLISPSGTKTVLTSNTCGSLNNINAVFDDDGSMLNCLGNPAISGVVQPLGSLAAFKGESTLGDWTLQIEDTAPSDGGSLVSFSLEVCAEGIFRPDDDGDGVFDDGDDLCLGTPKGVAVDTNGCPLNDFAVDNFQIEISSESCRTNNDGRILITAMDTALDYTVTLIGGAVNETAVFSDMTSFENLQAGSYALCINGSDGTVNYREQCFDIVLDEPDELTVGTTLVSRSQLQIELEGGSLYNIELNGVVLQALESRVLLDLKNGTNTLKVFTNLPCQGTYEASFQVAGNFVLFPNPVIDSATVSFPATDGAPIFVEIFTIDGRLVNRRRSIASGNEIQIDFEGSPPGIYFVKLLGEETNSTFKVIKR